MKLRILKAVIPMSVLMLAVVGAFATKANNTYRTAYYEDPILGIQSVTVSDDCLPNGNDPCMVKGAHQVYAEITLDTPLGKN